MKTWESKSMFSSYGLGCTGVPRNTTSPIKLEVPLKKEYKDQSCGLWKDQLARSKDMVTWTAWLKGIRADVFS